MPKTVRTPPPPTSPPAPVESDSGDTEQKNITRRGKRKLVCYSPETTNQIKNEIVQMHNQFKEEITEMLTTWKAEQDTTLSKIVSNIADLKVQFVEIQKTNVEIEKNVQFVSNKYDEMLNKIKDFEKNRAEFQENLSIFQNQLHDIQCTTRSASIELRNIPEKEKESYDDLKNVLQNTGRALQTDIKPSEIRDIYRLPGKTGGAKTIIAELSTVHAKDARHLCSPKF